MTVADLKKIWEPAAQGKITRWNQVRPNWPNAPIRLFGPGADSGTFDYFTEAIVGKSGSSRTDFTASEDDNVLVQGVTRDRNALGYFGFSYFEANKARIGAVSVVNKQGKAVTPSRQAVQNGSYNPLSRPIFIYVSANSAKRREVRDFVTYYINNAPKLVAEVDYVPLPRRAYDLARGIFNRNRVGTVFGGEEAVGLTIEQLLSKEAK